MTSETRGRAPSRRDFLKGLGATGAGLVAGTMSTGAGLASPAAAADGSTAPVTPSGYARSHAGAPPSSVDFGRIFPGLPPFAEANDRVRAALLEVGMPGGIMDAGQRQRQPDELESVRHQSR
jgi:hypothetical protein